MVTCREEFYFPVLSSDIGLAKHGCLKCVSELINISFCYSQQKDTGIFSEQCISLETAEISPMT